jgi:predicted secreted protein
MTGKDLIVILSQNGTALASTAIRSQEIQTSAETIEKASATQQDWKEYVAGRKAWSLSVSYLVLTASKVADLLMVGQTFDVTVKDVDNTSSVSGVAILSSVKHTAPVGNLANGSFTFVGSGPLQ